MNINIHSWHPWHQLDSRTYDFNRNCTDPQSSESQSQREAVVVAALRRLFYKDPSLLKRENKAMDRCHAPCKAKLLTVPKNQLRAPILAEYFSSRKLENDIK